MYFPFFILHGWRKRSAIQPQTIYSEFPKYTGKAESAMKSKVYFSKTVTPEKVLELYRALGKALPGNIAIKLHSGEVGNQNLLTPEFWKPVIDAVGGTVAECNTAYEGRRFKTEDHLRVMQEHGFAGIAPVDIMDSDGETALKISGGKQIDKNYVGKNLSRYDSILILSHFKGHVMGGFGGALKNMSIGIASSHGKAHIHGAGDPKKLWDCEQDKFLEAMADADKSIVEFFGGRIAYINVMRNLSIDCDCDSNPHPPEMADIGILASHDPVALDQACVDLVYASPDKGKASLIRRIEERKGTHILQAAEELGIGSRKYVLKEM